MWTGGGYWKESRKGRLTETERKRETDLGNPGWKWYHKRVPEHGWIGLRCHLKEECQIKQTEKVRGNTYESEEGKTCGRLRKLHRYLFLSEKGDPCFSSLISEGGFWLRFKWVKCRWDKVQLAPKQPLPSHHLNSLSPNKKRYAC